MGNVCQAAEGQAPARQAALLAGESLIDFQTNPIKLNPIK